MNKPKAKKHYVNNKDLYDAMVVYKAQVVANQEAGKQNPRIPHYIGESIMKIATHLAYRPNFANYTFRDEMISDGIENCLLYINNFDPTKSANPFAYFTQIIYFAFIRRIQKEKKHLYTKYAAIEQANIMGETSDSQGGDGGSYDTDIKYGEWSKEQMEKFMADFEASKGIKRGSKKATT
jgi:hypothetical protein